MAPVGQRPLDLGAHISMTSGTKFIGGHGDVTLGILSVKGKDLAKRVYFLQVIDEALVLHLVASSDGGALEL
ncbi:cystathionine beta-lyase [Haematococcus lacustris]|uniref:Cystathionine beta-lyase n=1 Tax=Haematococcus lacustris TaxID=44745 RepID=A0A6A0AJX4_HAELA|nr:cystathionine beta-lyase [Haematococcus lacustris]